MKFILLTIYFYFSVFLLISKSGKYIKLNFLIKDQNLYAFFQNWNSVNAEKNATFFWSEEVHILRRRQSMLYLVYYFIHISVLKIVIAKKNALHSNADTNIG